MITPASNFWFEKKHAAIALPHFRQHASHSGSGEAAKKKALAATRIQPIALKQVTNRQGHCTHRSAQIIPASLIIGQTRKDPT